VLVIVGSGDEEDTIKETASELADSRRIVMAGKQTGRTLANAYAAMDVFAFSSKSETQGMVLAEAMAARTPVIALDGPGVRDVLNETNGRLLPADAPVEDFAAALNALTSNKAALQALGESARLSVRNYSVVACADRLLSLYVQLTSDYSYREDTDPAPWDRLLRRLEIEWNLLIEKTAALRAAVVETDATKSQLT
jgi:1,2-diacylglycerol 3-alpha-glucosyltransferase